MSIKISNKKQGLYFKVRKVAVQDFFKKGGKKTTKNNGVNVKCKYIDLQIVLHRFQSHKLAVPEAAHPSENLLVQLPLCF